MELPFDRPASAAELGRMFAADEGGDDNFFSCISGVKAAHNDGK